VRVLFSSTWGVGHIFPMVPLARAFLAAGHVVRWVTNEPACPVVHAAGLDVVAGGLDTPALTEVRRRLREGTAPLAGPDRAAYAFPNMFGSWATPAMVDDLLPLARGWHPDLLVREPAEFAAPLVGALLGVRCLTHAWGGAVPAALVQSAADRVAGLWAERGPEVPPYAGSYESTYLDPCPPLVQPVSVDHIPVRQPLNPVSYTGERSGPLPSFLRDDSGPLVYLTLGTVQNQAPVLSTAVSGLSALGPRVLVTVGPDGDPAALGPQPGHVQVERWVCQSDVLPRASVVVSHAGSGTFLGALGLGVPQVCLPQAADQFRNAEAGVRIGAAVMLSPDEASSSAIEAAVRRVLGENSFRAAAARVAEQISSMPSPAEVVSLLER